MISEQECIDLACIIDDDKIYVNLIRKVIESRNLSKELLVFGNGKEALEYFEKAFLNQDSEKIPNIIFLDINMPIMDGWQFLEHFVQFRKPLKKSITLYIVSSSINPKDIEKANELESISGYIIKPVKPKDLEVLFRKIPN
ncbi:response regulator [Ascidiimonas sp. W6]|uniref:response regulator n=1 Tax=Ascidiimonas meishanensis TaxID=3128903 RepID=UPI0030EC46F2